MFHRMEIISCILLRNKVKGMKSYELNFIYAYSKSFFSNVFLHIIASWNVYIQYIYMAFLFLINYSLFFFTT